MRAYRLRTFFSSAVLCLAGLALSVWQMRLGRFSGLWWFIYFAVWLFFGLRASLTESGAQAGYEREQRQKRAWRAQFGRFAPFAPWGAPVLLAAALAVGLLAPEGRKALSVFPAATAVIYQLCVSIPVWQELRREKAGGE